MVQTPVGAKCKQCGTNKGGSLSGITPVRAAAASGVGLVAGAVAGWGAEFAFGLLTLFLAFAYGGFAGELILRASGRRRGAKLEVLSGVTMILGAVGGRLLVAATLLNSGHAPPTGLLDVLADFFERGGIPAAAVVIAIFSAISRIRYV